MQHLDKQIQDVNINALHFDLIGVPISASVLLNEDQKLEQIEHCIVRVPIQPSVQKYGPEQKTWIEHKIHVSTVSVPVYSSGQIKWKLQNRPKHLTTKTTEKDELNKQ